MIMKELRVSLILVFVMDKNGRCQQELAVNGVIGLLGCDVIYVAYNLNMQLIIVGLNMNEKSKILISMYFYFVKYESKIQNCIFGTVTMCRKQWWVLMG